jgi:AcrR family transcriptional regulator
MPRHKQSSEQISTMQNRILDATVSLLDELQPEEISIRKIAERAEISHMVIYTYFKDRDELVKALITRQEERIRQRFEDMLKNVNDSNIIAKLRTALSDYIDIAKARPKLFRLLWILPVKPPVNPARGKRFFENQINLLSDLFSKGQQRGIFVQHDPQVAALIVLSIINAPMFLFHLGRMADPKLCDQVINETLDIVLQYITGK